MMAPLLKISTSNLLLLPVHIVLLELIIDPTSSIIFERQPADEDIMDRMPRSKSESLVNFNVLSKSIFQGLFMFLGSFLIYFYFFNHGYSIETSRSMGLTIIVISNLFLVFVNSSENDYVYKSIKKIKKDKVMMLSIIITILSIFISFISIFWYEIVKFIKKV